MTSRPWVCRKLVVAPWAARGLLQLTGPQHRDLDRLRAKIEGTGWLVQVGAQLTSARDVRVVRQGGMAGVFRVHYNLGELEAAYPVAEAGRLLRELRNVPVLESRAREPGDLVFAVAGRVARPLHRRWAAALERLNLLRVYGVVRTLALTQGRDARLLTGPPSG